MNREEQLTDILQKIDRGQMDITVAFDRILRLFSVSESLPSDDEVKLTDNGFGALEEAIKKANSNVR